MIRKISLILLIAIIFSCSKKDLNYSVEVVNGVKTYKNENRESMPDLVIQPKELYTIKDFDETITDSTRIIKEFGIFDTDSKGNIYILDGGTCSVKKFDPNGKFVKSFGKRGHGPGESSYAWNMTITNDTIIFDDYLSKEMLRFDLEGNFINKFSLTASGPTERFKGLNDGKIIGYQAYQEDEGDDAYVSYNFSLFDDRLVVLKELANKRVKFEQEKYNFFDLFLSAYTHSDKEIFFAEKSDSYYKINVFNFNGEHIYSITKNYIKIPFEKNEMDVFDKRYKDTWYFSNNKSKFKSAIINMEFDKYNRLWVFSSIERSEVNRNDLVVDIFKDGVYLKSIKLDICSGYDFVNYDHQIKLRGDKLFYVNTVDMFMKVYDY
ncbi:MAG: hypothetical protein JXR48_06325 [Candidatus Delongbacteria bacterium]|nr:hypothetical protein [Candidatus Delongbacteria bacterium]